MSLVVVQFSESFSDLWHQLGENLSVEVQLVHGAEAESLPGDAAAVVLAAGGAESQALDWLKMHAAPAGATVIAVGADPNRRLAVRLVAQGADDYLVMPEDVELLRNALNAVFERWRETRTRAEASVSEPAPAVFHELVGESPAFKAVLARAAQLLPHAGATALLLGETGTGKELLARAIHAGGPRRRAPFVPVNCSALPGNLVESELFGHERGAFTDAHAAKPGLFEVADGGTMFLDEIGLLPLELQAKLLRVLEDREIRRVGGTKTRHVDVRIIAATNDDLAVQVQREQFRRDLYFRLSVITLSLPPLRERGDDVTLIAGALLERLARQHGVPPVKIDAAARRALQGHAWPGNVRELRNALERAMLLAPPGTLNLEELLPEPHAATVAEGRSSGSIPFPAPLEQITGAAAKQMIELCKGNRSQAARRLGISRRRLRRLASETQEV